MSWTMIRTIIRVMKTEVGQKMTTPYWICLRASRFPYRTRNPFSRSKSGFRTRVGLTTYQILEKILGPQAFTCPYCQKGRMVHDPNLKKIRAPE
jgi:hypothetical protein